MENSKIFNYDQPTRDTLSGIYVEATDEALDQEVSLDSGSARQLALQSVALFGLTQTVDETAKDSNVQPASH
jgi:hypothetical protein